MNFTSIANTNIILYTVFICTIGYTGNQGFTAISTALCKLLIRQNYTMQFRLCYVSFCRRVGLDASHTDTYPITKYYWQ